MEMLLTGDRIDSPTAVEWGLVNRAVPDERLDAEVEDLVDRILTSSRRVVGLGKRLSTARWMRPRRMPTGRWPR